MTIVNQSHVDEQTAVHAQLLESCWHMRGPAGIMLRCAVYRVQVSLELRIFYNNESVNVVPLENLEEGRARAATLKGMVCKRGGFTELAN